MCLSNSIKFDRFLSKVISLCFSFDDVFLLVSEINGCIRGFNLFETTQNFLLFSKFPIYRMNYRDNLVELENNRKEIIIFDREKGKRVTSLDI